MFSEKVMKKILHNVHRILHNVAGGSAADSPRLSVFLPTKKPKLGELGFGSKTRDQELAVLCVPSC